MEESTLLPWRVELLGRLRACREERAIERFESSRAALLLAYLAYYPRQRHPREELIEILWPEVSLSVGRNRLKQALASLRRQLEPPELSTGAVFFADRFSLEANAQLLTTDARAFEVLVSTSDSLPRTLRLQQLSEALALYHGELLPGFYEEWVLAERERLAALRRSALTTLAELLREDGQTERALQTLHRLVADDPLEEGAQFRLMQLYAEAGRIQEARHQYRALDRVLQETLGVPPSSAIREYAAQLERQAEEPLPLPRAEPMLSERSLSALSLPSRKTAFERPGNVRLPAIFSRFFGREAEIARIAALIAGDGGAGISPVRLLTLTGGGGFGKTRLAIEAARSVAERFEGGVYFVSLAEARDGERIVEAIAAALRLPPERRFAPLNQVIESLNDQCGETLFVLDNFEQVVDAGAPIVRALLEQVPTLICLVTSRLRLNLEGEEELPVLPLSTPEETGITPAEALRYASVRAFVDRAQKARPDFQITARNVEAVVALCQRLEGIPLALELAAAWARMLTPAHMVERLSARFDLLVSRRRDIEARHHSLRAAIAWSYDLLTPEQQRLFASLSVFQGGWTLEAANAILLPQKSGDEIFATSDAAASDSSSGVGQDCLTLLTQLHDASLLMTEEQESGIRFRFLETLREFASEQLNPQERVALRRRHAVYYAGLAAQHGPRLATEEAKSALAALAADLDNLRVGLVWAWEAQMWETGLRLAVGMAPFLRFGGLIPEARLWLDRFLDNGEVADQALLGWGLAWAGILACICEEVEPARARLEASLRIRQAVGNPEQIANSLKALGILRFYEKKFEAAISRWEECLKLYEQAGNRLEIALALFNLATGYSALNRKEEARNLFERSLVAYRQMEPTVGLSFCLISLGELLRSEGDAVRATQLYAEAAGVYLRLGYLRSIPRALEMVADALTGVGQMVEATRLLGAATELGRKQRPPLLEHDALEKEMLLSRLRAALSEEAFAAAWEEGSHWDEEQAVTTGIRVTQSLEPPTAA